MTQGSSASPQAGGITLDRYLDKKGVLDPTLASKVVLQIAAQLAREKIPTSVTPQRVVILAGGKIALRHAAGQDTVVEAPEYASPEEIRGEPADARSVLYSLGCTFYELLVGEPPFVDDDPDAVLRSHLEGAAPDPREHVQGVSDEITAIIRELLAKEPDFRIQTAQQLAVRLRGAVHSAPQAAAAVPASSRPARSRPRPAAGRSTPAAGRSAQRGTAPRRAVASRSRGRAAARGAHGEAEEGRFAPKVVARKKYPFTIGGACLGVLLGFVFALNTVKSQHDVPARERDRREAQLDAKRAKALADRKEALRERFERQDQGIEDRVLGIRGMENPVDVRDSLMTGLATFNDGATAPFAVKRLVEIWEEAERGVRRVSASEAEDGFREHREAANALLADEKLGEAIKRIRRAELEFQETHGKEIDAFIERVSKELEDKWAADVARAKELARAGEPDAAIELMRKAMDYGDGPIRRDAEKTIVEIQSQALVSSRTGEDETPGDDTPEDTEAETGDDLGDLEAEFEDFELE